MGFSSSDIKAAVQGKSYATGRSLYEYLQRNYQKVYDYTYNGIKDSFEAKPLCAGNAVFKISKSKINVSSSPTIKINPSKKTLIVGKSITLKASLTGKSKKVSWRSSNKKIATVSSNGKVTAKKKGTAYIYGTANGVTSKCKITVTDWYDGLIKEKSRTFTGKDIFGKKVTLKLSNCEKYVIIDINKDGMKEVIFFGKAYVNGSYEPKNLILSFAGGKIRVVTLLQYVRGLSYKGKYLNITYGSSSSSTDYIYTFNGSTLKKIITLFHTTSSAYPVPLYEINGKRTTKEKFYSKYNKYCTGRKFYSDISKPF